MNKINFPVSKEEDRKIKWMMGIAVLIVIVLLVSIFGTYF